MIVTSVGNSVWEKAWEMLAFQVRTQLTMEVLSTPDPMESAREQEASARAFSRKDGEEATRLLARHSNRLAELLRKEHRVGRRTEEIGHVDGVLA